MRSRLDQDRMVPPTLARWHSTMLGRWGLAKRRLPAVGGLLGVIRAAGILTHRLPGLVVRLDVVLQVYCPVLHYGPLHVDICTIRSIVNLRHLPRQQIGVQSEERLGSGDDILQFGPAVPGKRAMMKAPP